MNNFIVVYTASYQLNETLFLLTPNGRSVLTATKYMRIGKGSNNFCMLIRKPTLQTVLMHLLPSSVSCLCLFDVTVSELEHDSLEYLRSLLSPEGALTIILDPKITSLADTEMMTRMLAAGFVHSVVVEHPIVAVESRVAFIFMKNQE